MLRPAPSRIAQGGERAGADSAVLQCGAAQLLQAAGRRSCCRLVDGSLSSKVGQALWSVNSCRSLSLAEMAKICVEAKVF